MNKRIGIYSSIVTFIGVVGFALSMLIGSDTGSYLFSLIISFGFVPMISSFTALGKDNTKSAGYTALAFASIYAALVGLVYFAQLTTIRLTQINAQATNLLDYKSIGSLFFYFDLLGYAFMSLSTFFIAFTINVKDSKGKWLRNLLSLHGIFAITCIVFPIMGLFNNPASGSDTMGVIALLFWCLYFTPICILSYSYFKSSLN